VLRYARCDQRRAADRKTLWFGEIAQVCGVNDKEKQSGNHRNPYQEPSDMDGTFCPRDFWPTLGSPCCSCTPPMARFTRFSSADLVSVELQRTAPARPVSRHFLRLLHSWFAADRVFDNLKRRGRAAAPFTAIRIRSILPLDTIITEATFNSGKSHTFRLALSQNGIAHLPMWMGYESPSAGPRASRCAAG